MATDLDLVNAALTGIGQEKIPSLDNTVNSKVIQTANIHLPLCKRAVLRANDWNCARRRARLNLLPDDHSMGEWAQSYRLPSDCLAVRRFVGISDEQKSRPYSVELDADGNRLLLTNVEGALIVYTTDLQDVNRYDSLLFYAVSTRLSVEFAIAFPRDLKFMSALWQAYRDKIEEAVGADEAEGGIEKLYSRDMVTVRNF